MCVFDGLQAFPPGTLPSLPGNSLGLSTGNSIIQRVGGDWVFQTIFLRPNLRACLARSPRKVRWKNYLVHYCLAEQEQHA